MGLRQIYILLISRYDKVFGSRLDRAKFEDLADRSRTSKEIAAEACFDLIKIASSS